MKTTVGVSRRHVHLKEETYRKLFGDQELEVRNPLNQPGQFASTSTVDIKVGDKAIEHVRIVGPLRKYNQIEIDQDEADYFEVQPPRRQSGDLEGSLPITVIGPLGAVDLEEGLILAERHIHMTIETSEKEGFTNKEEVEVYKDGKYIFNAIIKISDPAYNEIHIDTKEEKEYNLHTSDEVEFRKCGK